MNAARAQQTVPRHEKRAAGRTPIERTPLVVRTSGVALDADGDDAVRKRATRRLRPFAPHIERLTIRFEDVNGPRGGVDVECRVKIVVSSARSVHGKARGRDAGRAFSAALDIAIANLKSLLERRLPNTPRIAGHQPVVSRDDDEAAEPGSLIGRRVGPAAANLEAALERPEKRRRDAPVDTAAPGKSATDRRAGGAHTARRNTKRRASRARAMLEDSLRDRPSRKSTRRSHARGKQDDKLRLRATLTTRGPKARATRARAKR